MFLLSKCANLQKNKIKVTAFYIIYMSNLVIYSYNLI